MELLIRPMQPDDLAAACQVTQASFRDADVRLTRRGSALPAPTSPDESAHWTARTAHLLDTDPAGCWVAESDDGIVGIAVSYRRELTWILATLAVDPHRQSSGVGSALLNAAVGHSFGCSRGMLSASDDTRAYRAYWRLGFALYPELTLTGPVDRSTLPDVTGVREGTAADFELMDSLDRRLRGSAHGPDHVFLAESHRLLVVDRPNRSGYAWVRPDGSPAIIAATGRATADDLLWQVLADVPAQEVNLRHLTTANRWAIDIGLTAGLAARTDGHLGVRGLKPPTPYVHHGALL